MRAVKFQPAVLGKEATIYSITSITDPNNAPTDFVRFVPYSVALIQTSEGPLTSRQVTDIGDEEVDIGTPVEPVVRILKFDRGHDGYPEKGIVVYGIKYRPLLTRR